MSINPLSFQYQLRSTMLEGLEAEDRNRGLETRDRELEDYLGSVDSRVGGAVKATGDTMTSWVNSSVPDDTVLIVAFSSEARGLLALSSNIVTAGAALIMFRTGATAQCALMSSVTGGPTVTCGTGVPLTGTTGVDGHLTFRTTTTNNNLYIENRTGATRGYAGAFLAMTLPGGGFTVS